MTQFNTYLTFDGNCAEAMRFYERVLNGKIKMLTTVGESPMAGQMPPETHGRIMHVSLQFPGGVLMASDSMYPNYQGMHGFTLALSYATAEEGKAIFDVLADGGKVEMPLQKTFWADAFGMLSDRYGTPWMINCGDASG